MSKQIPILHPITVLYDSSTMLVDTVVPPSVVGTPNENMESVGGKDLEEVIGVLVAEGIKVPPQKVDELLMFFDEDQRESIQAAVLSAGLIDGQAAPEPEPEPVPEQEPEPVVEPQPEEEPAPEPEPQPEPEPATRKIGLMYQDGDQWQWLTEDPASPTAYSDSFNESLSAAGFSIRSNSDDGFPVAEVPVVITDEQIDAVVQAFKDSNPGWESVTWSEVPEE